MTHPARRVMPNGTVGRKLQHIKCISKASAFLCPYICEVTHAAGECSTAELRGSTYRSMLKSTPPATNELRGPACGASHSRGGSGRQLQSVLTKEVELVKHGELVAELPGLVELQQAQGVAPGGRSSRARPRYG
jgi:hypothetical protein